MIDIVLQDLYSILLHFYMQKCCISVLESYLDEESVVLLVLGLTAVPEGGVLPVEVQPVEVVRPQEPDRGPDEGLAVFFGRHQGRPSRGALVPSTHSYERLELFVVRLQADELCVATCTMTGIK